MPERLSTFEAARRAGVDVTTVRRWIHRGQLEAVRMGPKLLKVDADVLDKFLSASA